MNMVQYLSFLFDFMATTGQSNSDVAKRVGVSKSAVSDWFKRGDMRLSTAVKILNCYGCTLHFYLRRNVSDTYSGDGRNIINISLENLNIDVNKLTNLRNAIKTSGKTMKEVANALDIAPETLTYYWKTDDCPVSAFYKIASIIGYETIFKIEEDKKRM